MIYKPVMNALKRSINTLNSHVKLIKIFDKEIPHHDGIYSMNTTMGYTVWIRSGSFWLKNIFRNKKSFWY